MKRILFSFLFVFLGLTFSSGNFANKNIEGEKKIQWLTFEEAVEKSKETPKKIIIDLYTDRCGWCKRMDKTTFQNPIIADYINENYYAVKLNAEQKENIEFEHVIAPKLVMRDSTTSL